LRCFVSVFAHRFSPCLGFGAGISGQARVFLFAQQSAHASHSALADFVLDFSVRSRCLGLVFLGRAPVGPDLVFRPTPAKVVLAPVPILFKSAAAPVLSAGFVFGFPSPALIIAVRDLFCVFLLGLDSRASLVPRQEPSHYGRVVICSAYFCLD
jgi:hypothetical protein